MRRIYTEQGGATVNDDDGIYILWMTSLFMPKHVMSASIMARLRRYVAVEIISGYNQ